MVTTRTLRARQAARPRRCPHALARPLRRPRRAAGAAGRARSHGGGPRLADVRQRPDRRLHDRSRRPHDRGLDGGRRRPRRRGPRAGGARTRSTPSRSSTPRPARRARSSSTSSTLWRAAGIGGHRIGAFAQVARSRPRPRPHRRPTSSAASTSACSCPLRAQDQHVWDWTGRLDGPDAPGSWGGHAVDVVGYDDAGLTVVTWGALQRLTWAFWDRYCDEGWCIVSTDFLVGRHDARGLRPRRARAATSALVTGRRRQ